LTEKYEKEDPYFKQLKVVDLVTKCRENKVSYKGRKIVLYLRLLDVNPSLFNLNDKNVNVTISDNMDVDNDNKQNLNVIKKKKKLAPSIRDRLPIIQYQKFKKTKI